MAKGTSYNVPLEAADLTGTNISAIKRAFKEYGKDGVVHRMDPNAAAHFKRGIRAKVLISSGDGGWKIDPQYADLFKESSMSQFDGLAEIRRLSGLDRPAAYVGEATSASPVADVVRALNGVRIRPAGKLVYSPTADEAEYGVVFDTPEGEHLSGDDYDYLDDWHETYVKPLVKEVLRVLAKSKVTGWNFVRVSAEGYLNVSTKR